MPKVWSDLDFRSDAKPINLPLPSADGDAANKQYVDLTAQGLHPHESVFVSTTSTEGNIDLSSAPATIDGETPTSGDRILVKNQTLPVQNGIYDYNGSGSAMTRSADLPAAAHAQGAAVYVNNGTHATQTWVCITEAPDDVVGTDDLSFTQWTTALSLTFRDGLKKTGTYVDVDPDTTKGLEILGGAGTSGKLAVNIDDAAYGGNGSGLQFDQSGANGGLSVKPDGTTIDINSSGQLRALTSGAKRYSTTVGDGSTKNITVTHSLNTEDVVVEVRSAAGNKDMIVVDWWVTGVNTIQLRFKSAPALNEFRVTVLA